MRKEPIHEKLRAYWGEQNDQLNNYNAMWLIL